MIGQEGASYRQMRVYQKQADQIMQANPAVETTFTMTGNSQFLPSNQGFVLAFLKDANVRPSIQVVTGQLMAKMSRIINALVIMQPSPVLQISTGATQNNQGKYAYALSGIDRDEVDAAAMKLQAAMQARPRYVRHGLIRFVQPYAESSDQHPARRRFELRRFRRRNRKHHPSGVFPELRLSHQETRGPVPGDSGSRRQRSCDSLRSFAAVRSVR